MFFDTKQLENEALCLNQQFTIKNFKLSAASVFIGFLFMFSGGALEATAEEIEAGENGGMQIPIKRIAYIEANGSEESHRYEYNRAILHAPACNQIIEVNIKDGVQTPNIDMTTVRNKGAVDGYPLVNGTRATSRDGPNRKDGVYSKDD
ncbi:TPA: hypothetical protein ACGPA6_002212 [Streptococcus suis]